MKATKQELITELRQLEKKYEMLVWFARKSSEQITTIEEVKNEAQKLMENYPEEITCLVSPLFGNWHHGFNSGMLAATRFAQDVLSSGVDEGYRRFPDLNS